ncbi:group II intron reverse transcriptase/maturase [Massilia scottii]|uniref:group II intron reverse transcriptase/maturase n=1 Tax=Massilia scottii TaxID=3057166 RepID=UPI002796974A|nr:group II intron reverse transcriptase/maturase [Massilia sp. CCM 9029]MDQ1831666.1 group II intron reverse transcriptase/maturase [Massilia sp. CCM 9029]
MPASAGRVAARRGEASSEAASDETRFPRQGARDAGQDLPRQALARESMQRAWKRVKANKGAAGVDGLDIARTGQHLKHAWPTIRQQLMEGTYRPLPVRRVRIPKPDGSERALGIPTVTDRLIQQALLQVLQPLIDPAFSEHSHGFRPGRRARDAVLAAQQYAQEGFRGVVAERAEGTPQGGPLSPLLANVLLDEVDRELERRGHRFTRYADDCNVYVRSRKAGERVMALLKRRYDRLHLKINESKSAVTGAFGRKFLGFGLYRAPKGEVKRAVSKKALATFRQRIRQLTRRSGGRSISEVIDKLRSYVLGWKAYYGLAQTPRVLLRLDEWMRHRMRAIHLKRWRHGTTIYRELMRLGAKPKVALLVSKNSRRWWRNSAMALNNVLTIAYFDRLGMPRLT